MGVWVAGGDEEDDGGWFLRGGEVWKWRVGVVGCCLVGVGLERW